MAERNRGAEFAAIAAADAQKRANLQFLKEGKGRRVVDGEQVYSDAEIQAEKERQLERQRERQNVVRLPERKAPAPASTEARDRVREQVREIRGRIDQTLQVAERLRSQGLTEQAYAKEAVALALKRQKEILEKQAA